MSTPCSSGGDRERTPVASYVQTSGGFAGTAHRDALAGRRARIAAPPEDLHRADLRREEALGAVELLHVLHRALVGLRRVHAFGIELERHWPRTGVAALSRDRRVEPLGVRRHEDLAARELLFEVAVDLAPDAFADVGPPSESFFTSASRKHGYERAATGRAVPR